MSYTFPLRRAVTHLAVLALFGVFAVVWTWPLAANLTTHLPGAHAGDNVGFLWNVWWFRRVLDRPELSFLYSDRIFAPFGLDLTLHTHAAIPSVAAAALAPALPTSLIGAQNLVIVASFALNGFAAYLLAFDRMRHTGPALLAGAIFAASPFFSTRLLGHFNLVCAWGLPLFLLLLLRAWERGSVVAAALAGLAAAVIAYTDYYYLTYCALFAAAMFGASVSPVAITIRRSTPPAWLVRGILAILAIDAAVIAWILATGGTVSTIAGVTVQATSLTNPLAAAWLLAFALLVAHRRPAFAARGSVHARIRRVAPVAATLLIVTVAGIAPLAVRGVGLWRSGDYTAPDPSWRSSPGGVDLATVVLGNPRHPLTGGWTRAAYQRLNIDPIEGSAWPGVIPVVLALIAMVIATEARSSPATGDTHRHAYGADRRAEARLWLVVALCAFVWALGPWLRIGGFNTGLFLPQNIAAHLPLLSNARIPGRAMTFVYLGMAMLSALAVASMPRRRQLVVLPFALAATLVDYIGAPIPLIQPRLPVIYADILAAGGDAAVLEVPTGLRDGFGTIGRFDDLTLFYQIVHEHPIVGGFAARVPARIKQQYAEMPFIRSLMRLSAGIGPDPRDTGLTRADALDTLRAAHIGYVMVNHELAPDAAARFVSERLPVILARQDGGRDLYLVTGAAVTAAAPPPAAPGR